MGVAATRAKLFMLHIHDTQEAFSWHIGYNIHYVIHGYTHLLHREDQARLASRPIVLSYSGGSLGTRLREPLLGHKRKLLGHVPQCVATPL